MNMTTSEPSPQHTELHHTACARDARCVVRQTILTYNCIQLACLRVAFEFTPRLACWFAARAGGPHLLFGMHPVPR
jgi:hypothetical protein